MILCRFITTINTFHIVRLSSIEHIGDTVAALGYSHRNPVWSWHTSCCQCLSGSVMSSAARLSSDLPSFSPSVTNICESLRVLRTSCLHSPSLLIYFRVEHRAAGKQSLSDLVFVTLPTCGDKLTFPSILAAPSLIDRCCDWALCKRSGLFWQRWLQLMMQQCSDGRTPLQYLCFITGGLTVTPNSDTFNVF